MLHTYTHVYSTTLTRMEEDRPGKGSMELLLRLSERDE